MIDDGIADKNEPPSFLNLWALDALVFSPSLCRNGSSTVLEYVNVCKLIVEKICSPWGLLSVLHTAWIWENYWRKVPSVLQISVIQVACNTGEVVL
jgi:hypothetical protein